MRQKGTWEMIHTIPVHSDTQHTVWLTSTDHNTQSAPLICHWRGLMKLLQFIILLSYSKWCAEALMCNSFKAQSP